MMATWEKWILHLLTLGVSLSGLVFYWMKYLLETDDPFSLLNHPWQGATLDLHLILSPPLVFFLGMVTRSHVSRKLENGTRPARRSGLLTLFSLPVMVFSGYLPQVVAAPFLIDALLTLHLLSGLLFFGSYLAHYLLRPSLDGGGTNGGRVRSTARKEVAR